MRDRPASGYLGGRLPFNRVGTGSHVVLGCQGLFFDNRPLPALRARMVMRGLDAAGDEFSFVMARPSPGLAPHSSTREIASSYADVIGREFEPPVDVFGVSVGGFVAQWLAIDHPELVRRLILAFTACRFGTGGAALQRRLVSLATARRWRAAAAASTDTIWAGGGASAFARAAFWLFGPWLVGAPTDPSDYLIMAGAALEHDATDQLSRVAAPTLVIGSDRDPLFPQELIGATAASIPRSDCVLLSNARHGQYTRTFAMRIAEFLR